MSKYYVKTENSRGSLVTASQPLFAQVKLQTLRAGVTKFNSQASEASQVVGVRVTFERLQDGTLALQVRADSAEPISLTLEGDIAVA